MTQPFNRKTHRRIDMTTYYSKGSGQGMGFSPANKKTHLSPGSPPKMLWIDKLRLQIDTENYQRDETCKSKTRELASNFKWAAFGALYVAQRDDGSLQVFEGGHRLRAALQRPDITEVPCLVYEMSSISQEADSFKKVNENRSSVSAYNKWKAGIVAKNPYDLRAKMIVEEHGIEVTKNASKRTNQFNAIGCLVWLVRDWPDYAHEVFNAAVEIHKPEDKPIKDNMLRGLCWLQRNGVDVCNPKKHLLKNLVNAGSPIIEKSMRSAVALSDRGGEKSFGKGILDVINKGKRRKIPMPNIDDAS